MKSDGNGKQLKKAGAVTDYKERKRHLIVPVIFSAVADAWLKKGLKNTISMEDIATEMGGTTGILYYYFKSKGDLIYQIQKYLIEKIDIAIRPLYDDKTIAPRKRLEQILIAFMTVHCDNWKIARVIWADYVLNVQPPHLAKKGLIARYQMQKSLKDLLDEVCLAEGLDATDNKLKVQLFFNMINNIWGWYMEGKGYSGQEITRLTVSYIMQGFLPDK